MFNNISITEKTVLITGASGGIGVATARQLASEGARLILCARNIEKLQALKNELKANYTSDIYCADFDITSFEQIQKFFISLPLEWRGVDILINNAGLALGLDKIQNSKISDIETMIDCNIKGMLSLTNLVSKTMAQNNRGHIVNICSISGHVVYQKGAAYCATKHAVRAISQGLRMDFINTNIRVSNISPGLVKTGFNAVRFGNDIDGAKSYEDGKYLMPEDVAEAILYCITRSERVNVDEIIIMPQGQVAVTILNKYN